MGQVLAPLAPGTGLDERAARRDLREQLARLERELQAALATLPAAERARLAPCGAGAAPRGVPRLLSLGELEEQRDLLADRLVAVRHAVVARADHEERARALLERMLLEPGRHRFVRLPVADLGEPGCGVYQVRPRLGLIGMLCGWWQVKLSSGCPLARGRRGRAVPDRDGQP